MLKKVALILFIMSVLLAVNNLEKMAVDGEKKLMTTFNDVNFTLSETDLNIWGEYSKSYMNEAEMKMLGLKVAEALGLEPEYEEDYQSEEFKKIYTIDKKTKEADTTIKVVELIEEAPNNGLKVENYVVVNLVLRNRCGSILHYREKIKEIFTEFDMHARDNLTITSMYKGKIEESKAAEIVDNITKAMNCKVRDTFKTENIYSIYGYSEYINDYIVAKGEKINVDLALTYNELEDTTYLYAAIPVITIDY